MLKNKIIGFVLTVLLVLTTPGCSFSGLSDNDLLQPPKATGEKAEIQNLIESSTNGDYKLKYPQSGDYRSAIIMQDIDADGENEAIALYKNTKDSSTINIMFMNKLGSKWATIGSFSNGNSDVDRLYFGDIDNDGVNEIIVGWSSYLSGAGGNQITMYRCTNDTVSEVVVNADTAYTDMVFMDITNDGINDLVVLTGAVENTGQGMDARLYSCCVNNEEFALVSEIQMNPNIVSCSQIIQGYVKKNCNGIFIDGNTSNLNEQITQVIYYSSEKRSLINPLDIPQTDGGVKNITQRSTASVCNDIDNDGITEVPCSFVPTLYDDALTPCPITKWYKIVSDDGKTTEVMQTVASYFDGFYFILPESWKNKIVAVNENTSRTTTFYEIDKIVNEELKATEEIIYDSTESVSTIGTQPAEQEPKNNKMVVVTLEPVLTIKVFSAKDWKNEAATKISEGYTVLEEETDLVYTCKLGNSVNSEINLSTDQVSANFKLIN